MNDDELQQLRECCSTATTTNCSWAIYEVKNHAATMASIEANKMSETKNDMTNPAQRTVAVMLNWLLYLPLQRKDPRK